MAKRTLHVFEVQVVRSHVHPNEDLVTSRSAERFSIRAAGDLSANTLAIDLASEMGAQHHDHVSAIEVRRVVNGVPEKMTTAEKYRANCRRW